MSDQLRHDWYVELQRYAYSLEKTIAKSGFQLGDLCYICIRYATACFGGMIEDALNMTEKFNSYIDGISPSLWRELCVRDGELRKYSKGEEFVSAGTVGKYIGYVQSGTLKYVAYSADNAEHVVGLEFAGEFVADFPFSIYGQPSRVSIVAVSDCEIYCLSTRLVARMMEGDRSLKDLVAQSVDAIFDTVYDRYTALYTQTPQERYNGLINRHPDLFALFPLRDIASYLNITPTHLSRLRKNI